MTTRERTLSIGLGIFIGVGLLGFVGWHFVLSPMLEKDKQIKSRENEVAQLQLDILEITAQKKKFEANRQQSLPSDVGLSRTQYGILLEGLMRKADFAAGAYKIQVGEADSKSAPTIAPKKPAYTRLTYMVTVKGELYHLVDFMRSFYQQPLLHQIKQINVLRPSDTRAQGRKELDITMTVEALVLDNAPPRPTLLPVIREVALLSGAAAFTGHNMRTTAEGSGSQLAPADVLAVIPREYLSIAGKDVFFGPLPKPTAIREEPELPPEDDHSPFVTLTSIVGNDDGKIVAVFRDKLDNHNYVVTQDAKGGVGVVGEYELSPGRWKTIPGYSSVKPGPRLFFGTEEGLNLRMWRVRRVMLDGVIVERIEPAKEGEKPKLQPLEAIAGGIGTFVAVPEGKIYKVGMGQTLMPNSGEIKKASAPVKYFLQREAWRDIYAALAIPAMPVSAAERGR